MKILTYSTLFPDSTRPGHGIFVETRLRQLLQSGQVDSRVVAPVPWFPSRNPAFGEYASYAGVPHSESRNGLEVVHPRYPLIPKVGMIAAPWLMARWTLGSLRQLIRDGFDFDLIDAHYFYPDGVAAALLGKWLNKPVVITARGTDLNLIPKYRLPRKMILWAAEQSSSMITVCQALKDVLVEMEVPDAKVTVLRNGVNLEVFQPSADRDTLRQKLGMESRVMLSVGYLIPRKGHDLVISALRDVPDTTLFIIGSGPERENLEQLARQCGVADRVTFTGALSQDELRDYYGAADALALASSREGWANVLLESMACGTPVVATPVWGTPEVVATPEAGILSSERSDTAIAAAINSLFANYPDRARTRLYAEGFNWDATTQGQLAVFSNILHGGQ